MGDKGTIFSLFTGAIKVSFPHQLDSHRVEWLMESILPSLLDITDNTGWSTAKHKCACLSFLSDLDLLWKCDAKHSPCEEATTGGSQNQLFKSSQFSRVYSGSSKFGPSFIVVHWHNLLLATVSLPQALKIKARGANGNSDEASQRCSTQEKSSLHCTTKPDFAVTMMISSGLTVPLVLSKHLQHVANVHATVFLARLSGKDTKGDAVLSTVCSFWSGWQERAERDLKPHEFYIVIKWGYTKSRHINITST